MDGFGPRRHDGPEKDEIQVIPLILLLDGEIDGYAILLKLDDQVFLFLHHVRDLNADLGRSLIPRVGKLCTKKLGLINIFSPQLDDAALLQCLAAGLLDPLQQLRAHVGNKYQSTYQEHSRIQIMSKPKKEEKKSEAKVEAPQAVAEVFSMTRDVEVLHPYHLDGDLEMYSEEKLKAREELRNDVDVMRELTEITKLYEWTEMQGVGKIIGAKEYKHKQRALAVILRPDIDKQELQFIVDSDWQHDRITTQSREYLTKQKLIEGLWQLVDVWTIGDAKEEYLSFIRLLKKKLQRTLKTEK